MKSPKITASHTLWIVALVFMSAEITPLFARQVALDIQPRVISLAEAATLKLTFINLHPPQSPALPEIPGFDINYIGQESQVSIINGQQEQRLTYNYRLFPKSSGQFRIGPFSMSVHGQNIDLDAINIEVLPPGAASDDNKSQRVDDLIFARVQLPRNEVFLQERFDIEISLYYRGVQLDRGVQFQNLPSTGLNLEDLQEIGSTREAVGGEIYDVRRFRMRGTALTAGTFELAPMLRINVFVRRERPRDPFFGGFDAFFGRHETQTMIVPTETMNVVIRPLPINGRPDTFGGAVGKFDMELHVQPTEVNAGDPVTLTLRISGRGNFETISMPPINLGDDFRRYDPKLVASGRDHKVFEQVFIPRIDTIKELPPVSFSFFDPELKKYQTIVRGPYPLLVKAGSSDAPLMVQAPSPLPQPDRAPLGIDIVDLKRNPGKWRSDAFISNDTVPVGLHALPILALAALLVIQRRRDKFNANASLRRRYQAPKSARAAIRAAEQAMGNGQTARFYESLWQAIADYVGHRCNLEAGQISPELIIIRLQSAGLKPEFLTRVRDLLAKCDEVRFANADLPGEKDAMRSELQHVQEILRACEKIAIT